MLRSERQLGGFDTRDAVVEVSEEGHLTPPVERPAVNAWGNKTVPGGTQDAALGRTRLCSVYAKHFPGTSEMPRTGHA